MKRAILLTWPYSLVVFACLSDCIGQRWPSCAPTCSLGLPYSEHPVLLIVEMSFLVVLVLPCSRWFHHLTLSLARYSPLLVVDVPCYNPWLPCAVSLLGSLRLSAPLIASTFQFAVIVLSFAVMTYWVLCQLSQSTGLAVFQCLPPVSLIGFVN